METLLALSIALAVAVAAYSQARRAGLWSWKRFLLVAAALSILGGGVGAIVSSLGRHTRGEHALALTLLAVACIAGGVTLLAVRLRRR